MSRTVALVGAAGGVGTTRTAVECAAMLARDGFDAAVVDAAYATQGLSEYVPGRIDPDVTALCLDPDRSVVDGLVEVPLAGAGADADSSRSDGDATPGRVAVAPALAPFERVARAKTVEAAQALEARIEELNARFDAVLVDVPPVAANQSVAAVTAADTVAVVTSADTHGADAARRMTDRLIDVGASPDHVVAVGGALADADAAIPTGPTEVAAAPACLGDDAFAAGVADATRTVCDLPLDVEFDERGALNRLVDAADERLRG
ncbi:AAA family ATPase [Halobaculum sp. P14]|uniref:AAA family ATPase n=1 Tax=Halobaculum sp. P14 TaxID=3421638 RepID=UPI003EBEDAD4